MTLVDLDNALALDYEVERKRSGLTIADEARELEQDLGLFLRRAWHVVEPYEPYLHNWHIDALNAYLSAVSAGQIRKLQVWVPPGSMKSRAVTIMWPAWEWTTRPWLRYFSASYDILLATKLMGLWRALVMRDWYQARWPLEFEKKDERFVRNTAGGTRLATSPTSTGTGDHGDRLLIDDPISAKEAEALTGTKLQEVIDWYDGTLPTRFANPKRGVEVVIMQRLHEGDLAAHAMAHNPAAWEVLCLPEEYEPAHPYAWTGERVHPFAAAKLELLHERQVAEAAELGVEPPPNLALGDPRGMELVDVNVRQDDGTFKIERQERGELLWPDRVGREENAERKARMGRHRAAGQLQQRPAAREGEILMRADFRYYDPDLYVVALEDVEKLPPFQMVVQSWDTAFKELTTSDYVAGGVWGFHYGDKFLLRLFHQKAGLNRTIEEIQAYRSWAIERWPDARHYQVIEKAANGPDVIRKMKRATPGMMTYSPTVDKVLRAAAASPDLESHNVWVAGQANGDGSDYDPAGTPQDTQAFIEECTSFPNAANDDLVDQFSQAINWGRTKETKPVTAMSPADVRIPTPSHIPR